MISFNIITFIIIINYYIHGRDDDHDDTPTKPTNTPSTIKYLLT